MFRAFIVFPTLYNQNLVYNSEGKRFEKAKILPLWAKHFPSFLFTFADCMDWKAQIDREKLPRHVAVIMDGNGRWAAERNRPRVFGHRQGVRAVRAVTEAAAELGIPYLTLYAFSTENWKRPRTEVSALMGLLVETIRKEVETLNKNDIRLHAIGDLSKLPDKSREALLQGIEHTAQNKRMTLTLALNYSGRWDILQAVKNICRKAKNNEEELTEESFRKALCTHGLPYPELLIRTSGEMRISNFLLWEMAYTELYFSPVFWPDFSKEEFYKAISNFQQRERRFGGLNPKP